MRAGLEKAKQALEKESADLSADLRSLASSKQDVEHKKKKLEGQLNDLHSRFNESERQRAELSERISKTTVGLQLVASVTSLWEELWRRERLSSSPLSARWSWTA